MKKIKVILISCLCLLMMTGCTTNKIDSQKKKLFVQHMFNTIGYNKLLVKKIVLLIYL